MFQGKSTLASTPTSTQASTGPFHLMSVSGQLQMGTTDHSVTQSSAIRFVPERGQVLDPRLQAFLESPSQVDGQAFSSSDIMTSARQDPYSSEQLATGGEHLVYALGQYSDRQAATTQTDEDGLVVYQTEEDRCWGNDSVFLQPFKGSIRPNASASWFSSIWKPKTDQTY